MGLTKLRQVSWLAAALLGLALVVACQRQDATQPPQRGDASADPHAKLQQEMEKGMVFSRVVIVRLTSEGKRVEVTSVLPNEIATVKVAGQIAKTIFRINDAGDGLVLFSRDLLKGSSYRVELKFTELESRKGFVFPVLQPDGSLKERSFSLEKIAIPE
jgi:hypothetical protein